MSRFVRVGCAECEPQRLHRLFYILRHRCQGLHLLSPQPPQRSTLPTPACPRLIHRHLSDLLPERHPRPPRPNVPIQTTAGGGLCAEVPTCHPLAETLEKLGHPLVSRPVPLDHPLSSLLVEDPKTRVAKARSVPVASCAPPLRIASCIPDKIGMLTVTEVIRVLERGVILVEVPPQPRHPHLPRCGWHLTAGSMPPPLPGLCNFLLLKEKDVLANDVVRESAPQPFLRDLHRSVPFLSLPANSRLSGRVVLTLRFGFVGCVQLGPQLCRLPHRQDHLLLVPVHDGSGDGYELPSRGVHVKHRRSHRRCSPAAQDICHLGVQGVDVDVRHEDAVVRIHRLRLIFLVLWRGPGRGGVQFVLQANAVHAKESNDGGGVLRVRVAVFPHSRVDVRPVAAMWSAVEQNLRLPEQQLVRHSQMRNSALQAVCVSKHGFHRIRALYGHGARHVAQGRKEWCRRCCERVEMGIGISAALIRVAR
mmetsp:Transcript_43771/g.78205  ORF Transcript_43771/g.78205 Transcript_43771/m.78205 type:complete len:477 (+) Transcript_43771:211-1641(+)